MDLLIIPYLPIYGGRHKDEANIVSEFNRAGVEVYYPDHPISVAKANELSQYGVSVKLATPQKAGKMNYVLGFLVSNLFAQGFEQYLHKANRALWYVFYPDWTFMRTYVWEHPKTKVVHPYYERKIIAEFPPEPYAIHGINIEHVLKMLSLILNHKIVFNSRFSETMARQTLSSSHFSETMGKYGLTVPPINGGWSVVYLPVLGLDNEPTVKKNGKCNIIYPSRLGYDKCADTVLTALSELLRSRENIVVTLTRAPNVKSEWENADTDIMYRRFLSEFGHRVITPNQGMFTTGEYKAQCHLADIAILSGPHATFERSAGDIGLRNTALIAPDVSCYSEVWGQAAVLTDFNNMTRTTVDATLDLLDTPQKLEEKKEAMRQLSNTYNIRNFVTGILEKLEAA